MSLAEARPVALPLIPAGARDEWLALTRLLDELDLASGEATFEISATGSDLSDAVAVALSAIRSAIHAVGGGTPDFPTPTTALQAPTIFRAGHFEAEPVRIA